MANTYKVLGQSAPSATTETALYTVPASTGVVVSTLTVCNRNVSPDVIHDLFTFPYPFKDNSVDEIHCSHFIEHTPMEYVEVNGVKKDMLFAFIDEVYRILKPEGKATLIFPCATSTRAFQDPTHRRFIPAVTAYYFNREWRKMNKLDHYNVNCNFDFVIGEAVNGNWTIRSNEAKQFAGQHYWNVVDDLHFILTKK